ncbi:MAG: NADH-quinone oxidoreductase subunit D [candidate division Zixibacteria bacterium]|nr:NADH-quinone oxidoreductase subunit D [candidate division Zixibacteria bacterium]
MSDLIKDIQHNEDEFIINMGPQHPSTHGVLRLILKMKGEFIMDLIPDVGFLHRSLEKIAENRTYAQFMPFTDRVDYCASIPCNFAWAVAVEKLAEIEIPDRAQYLRVIMAELNRIASHLVWLGTMSLDLGAFTPFLYAFREREQILDMFEMTCGQRLTYNYMRIGGVSKDVPPKFYKRCKDFTVDFRKKVDDYEALLTYNPIFLTRTKNVAILPVDDALNYGASGPTIRASGHDWDLRKTHPYSSYDKFNFEIPTGKTGDVWDRYLVRIREMRICCDIIDQALEGLPEGPIMARVPKMFKPKPNEVYSRIEAPRGEMGYYIISDGTTKPYRVKIRTASFAHVQLMNYLCKGWKIADLVAIFGSLDIVLPEVDR